MQIAARCALLPLVALLVACNRGPSRTEALEAIRASNPTYDTAMVYGRVWQDGPPWFSCAEVLAKIGTAADHEIVRDAVGNWRSLIVAGWIVLRDSTKGSVADPGWCTAKLTDEGLRRVGSWPEAPGPTFPTGTLRRGWMVPVGHRKLDIVGAPRRVGEDSASTNYLVSIVPNENGLGTGAARDTLRYVADLHRVDGRWRMTATRAATTR